MVVEPLEENIRILIWCFLDLSIGQETGGIQLLIVSFIDSFTDVVPGRRERELSGEVTMWKKSCQI